MQGINRGVEGTIEVDSANFLGQGELEALQLGREIRKETKQIRT